MLNFRLFAVGVILALALLAGFLYSEATAVRPAPALPNSLSPARRLFILEQRNDADNYDHTGRISPLPRLLQAEPHDAEPNAPNPRRR